MAYDGVAADESGVLVEILGVAGIPVVIASVRAAPATSYHEALDLCASLGVASPVAAQMACSIADHEQPDDPEMRRGKTLAASVVELADQWGVPPAHLAFAYAYRHPNLASIVFGASSAEQLHTNVAAWETFVGLDAVQLERVRQLGE